MGNNYITTTERSGLTVAQVGGNDIYRMLHQIRSILELDGKLGEDYLSLFAEPVDGGRTIDWYADDEGKAVRVMELPREERQQVLQRFREMFESLHGYAGGTAFGNPESDVPQLCGHSGKSGACAGNRIPVRV